MITSIRMPRNDETLKALSELLIQDHVFHLIDGHLKSFFGVHKFFEKIKSGDIRVYGSFDDSFNFLGVCFGVLETDGETFNTHTMFHRKANAVKCYESCLHAMVNDYENEGVKVKAVVGYIPEFHRAAIIAARRAGCKDYGIAEDKFFIRCGAQVPCRILKKYVR